MMKIALAIVAAGVACVAFAVIGAIVFTTTVDRGAEDTFDAWDELDVEDFRVF